MFTPGRIAFVIFFVVAFVAYLIWSYRKDKSVSRLHFKHAYKVLIVLILFIILQFIIVKIRKFL